MKERSLEDELEAVSQIIEKPMISKRDDEEYCRQAFAEYLDIISVASQQVWNPVDRSNEPPDFELNLDGTKYAIDVTTLMEKVKVGDLSLTPIGITHSLWKIVRNVEKEAREQGKLHGAYYVGFQSPVHNLSDVRDEIGNFLLDYFERTIDIDKAEKVNLKIGYRQICSIAKVFNSETIVQIGGPRFVKWEGETNLPICSMLQEAINNKKHKLRTVKDPIILLLLDMYSFAESQAIKRCVSTLKGLGSFHSIFVAKLSGRHFMLWSVNPSWKLD